ncbi:hypothetical protein T484DRAFT_1906347 [Baffinella frigidus]|nr:hypothetical protein T484DRAFT_1906347 [Cryptophyta sp. CCMP2293]
MMQMFGTYPEGLWEPTEVELRVRGYTLELHLPAECAAVIHLPENAPAPGCFCFLFEIFDGGAGGEADLSSGSVWNCPPDAEMSLELCATVAAELFASNRDALQAFFARSEKGWRVLAQRKEDKTHGFSRVQVAQVVAELLFADFAPLPKVVLGQSQREIRVYVGHRLVVVGLTPAGWGLASAPHRKGGAAGAKGAAKAGGGGVEKGEVLSRGDDAVATALSLVALASLLAGPLEHTPPLSRVREHGTTTRESSAQGEGNVLQEVAQRSTGVRGGAEEGGAGGGVFSLTEVFARLGVEGGGRELNVLDPMCGVGSYLCAMAKVALALNCRISLRGGDQEEDSVALAQRNVGAHAERATPPFPTQLSQCNLFEESACPDGWADVVIVDPPWGKRHGTWSEVRKGTPVWARRWGDALGPGGVLVVVTIQTQLLERVAVPILRTQGVLLLESRKFNNSGWEQCKYFLFRKEL